MYAELPCAQRSDPVPDHAGPDHPSLYFNRELGWLDFNWRVFEEVRDPGNLLLERVRFLGIVAGNLDEFVQKRVGGLRRQEAAGVVRRSPDGRTPREQLALVREACTEMQLEMSRVWHRELKPLLRASGVRISAYDDLTEAERASLDRHFLDYIYPVVTPLAVDPGHPFPFISNLSLSLAIQMCTKGRSELYFARVKVPTGDGRWLRVPGSTDPHHFVPLEEVLRRNAKELFRGMELVSVHAFRLTRNADIRRDEEEAEDLLAMISEEIRERRSAPVVRLEVEKAMPRYVRELLVRELDLPPEDLVELEGELGLVDALELAALDLPDLKLPSWEPVVPARLARAGEAEDPPDLFAILQQGDLLVHHPYESFTASVQRLVEEAAVDPHVLAIKQTLYRTSDESPVVSALLRAAERGKQVAVLVEVKARFDEQNNIEWAQMLEHAGVHVTYGLVGLKTHAKALLVVRMEGGRPRAYCHIGTGNYHLGNARVYTDLGLLTCDSAIGADVVNLFHALTGHAPEQPYEQLVVAPGFMRSALTGKIRAEADRVRNGGEGRIIAKMNALDDVALIRELYEASAAGVRIELVVRGHCRLRPGVPGFSERIRVVSLIGRFLEHDRIFWFGNGGTPSIYIGSADWRGRNLDGRVEALVPVHAPELRDRLTRILFLALHDRHLAWELQADGRYRRLRPVGGEPAEDLHERLMREALGESEADSPGSQSSFEYETSL